MCVCQGSGEIYATTGIRVSPFCSVQSVDSERVFWLPYPLSVRHFARQVTPSPLLMTPTTRFLSAVDGVTRIRGKNSIHSVNSTGRLRTIKRPSDIERNCCNRPVRLPPHAGGAQGH